MSPGTFSLDARVVVQHRFRTEPLTGPFTVGLLTSAPTPEGSHSIELAVQGYSRQEIEFGPAATGVRHGSRRSGSRISFGPIGQSAGPATHGAVFDGNGDVFAYGWVQTCGGTIGPDEIAFEAGTIRLRF